MGWYPPSALDSAAFDPARTADIIYVYAESDFPAPVAGIITLENKAYKIIGNVSIANKLRFPSTGGCQLFANVTGTSTLSYTGTGAMFDTPTMTSSIVSIDRVLISSNDIMFNIDGTGAALLFVFQSIFAQSSDLGSISNVSATIKNSNLLNYGQGLVFNSISGLTFSENKMFGGLNQPGTKLISINGTHSEIQISDNFIETNGANEIIFDIDSASTTLGAVSAGNDFVTILGGTVFDPTGKNQSDPFWKFAGNTGTPDSASTVGANLTVPSAVAITVAGTYVRIDDTNTGGTNVWNLLDEERFSLNPSTGEITYTGRQQMSVQAIATATLEKVGGGTDVISIAFAKNGSVLTYSEAQTENTLPTAVTSLSRITLVNGDIISMWTRNQTGTADVLITQMVVSVK